METVVVDAALVLAMVIKAGITAYALDGFESGDGNSSI